MSEGAAQLERSPNAVTADLSTLVGRMRAMTDRVMSLAMPQRLMLGAAVVLVLAVMIAVLLGDRSRDDYRVLFSNVAQRDGAAIIASLQQMNVPYRFTEGGGAIMVPGPQVNEVRLRLAGQGWRPLWRPWAAGLTRP